MVTDILRGVTQNSVQALDKCNVLIVDQEGVDRAAVQRALRSLRGITLQHAATAEEALDALVAHKIDLIISDIFMPGLDEQTFLSTLHGDGYNVPVIALTGRGADEPSDEDRALAAGYGIAECLAKSAPAGVLRAAVMAILPDIDPAR